ncbi:hypothetical protein BP5796_04703 [Coleophoma crateriformis]|uniref:Nicotinamide N-methyltransferase n=1 Tax=Coleophoma crateriformis TaxID=565419 RepID=A0A3D8SA19_9HELO|nr:hypothetical protein BP5796_04703 [Coleophoma crateriformis]
MLTDKIRVEGVNSDDPEDILSSALGVIFPDDITNQHGDAHNGVVYLSPDFGSVRLTLCDPSSESRGLFSHFLWNSSLQLAEFIEEDPAWDVKGERVLELGAGSGLAGMIAGLKGAEKVVISDYPAPEVLENIAGNVKRNIDPRRNGTEDSPPQEINDIVVEGHEWGVLDDTFSMQNNESFGRILVADCLWMPWQHENLLKSIRWFMAPTGRAWVIAGFHTGREKMAGFYEEKRMHELGLEVEKIWERNAEGGTREWVTDRGIEDVTERKRWLVIAILKRKDA